ncbi:MAG TPA: ankyrin repeat domain-containing protein [Candidatus Megaira endosymbiont of Nemacystus decipiens]|nr:ankyrin repeat domain-containing protein [Candidatus Megaera endosymbiont of Nemacystus decipiens]
MKIFLVVKSENVTIDALEAAIKEGADVNAKDSHGRTPLHYLVQNESVRLKLVDYLIKNGADINVRARDNNTPLHYLLEKNESVTLKLLDYLIKNGADVNAIDAYNNTPSHCIVINKNVTPKLVNCLIENKANINVKNDYDRTPLHYLFYNKNATPELVNCLIKNGADINAKDNIGFTPFLHFMYKKAINIELAQHLLKLGFADNIKMKTKKFNSLFQDFMDNLCNVIKNEEESLLQQKQEAILDITKETISCFINNNFDKKNEIISGNFKYFNKEYSSVFNSNPCKAELYLKTSLYLLLICDKNPNGILSNDFQNEMSRLNQKSAPKAFYPLPPNLPNIDDFTSFSEDKKPDQLYLTGETSE